jgi:hypothetical protein
MVTAWTTCEPMGTLSPSSLATRILAPNVMAAPAQEPPTWRMDWYMTRASRTQVPDRKMVGPLPPYQAERQGESNRRRHANGGPLPAEVLAEDGVAQRCEEGEGQYEVRQQGLKEIVQM